MGSAFLSIHLLPDAELVSIPLRIGCFSLFAYFDSNLQTHVPVLRPLYGLVFLLRTF